MPRQAQKLSPKNFDALKSLFYHHIGQEHLAEQTAAIGNDLIRYYPQEAESWRAMIIHQIRSYAPCGKIKKTLQAIPARVYTERRVRVLNQILAACASHSPSADLNKLWHSTNKTKAMEKTIGRNLYLFGLGFDALPALLEQQVKFYAHKAKWIEHYHTHVILGDHLGAETIKAKIMDFVDPNAIKFTQLIDFSYRQKNTTANLTINPQHYPIFYGPYEIYAVLHLIWQSRQNGDNGALTDYLEHRPKFSIDVANHHPAVSLLLAQYANGQITQSQTTARKLFNQLEIYRAQHPQSYHFWQLPAYQFIALMYCAEQCSTAKDPLNELFSAEHLWWYDKHHLMEKILAPFTDDAMVQHYLQKVKTDQQRALALNGL